MDIFSLFKKRGNVNLRVDFEEPLVLPRDATKILWNHPIGSGCVDISPKQLIMSAFPKGITYDEYVEENPKLVFADAAVLDAIVASILTKKGTIDAKRFTSFFGNFTGQLFFLGTAFEALYGGQNKKCFAFLNWQTYYPAHRYMCPSDHPVNHDFPSYACHFEL